MVSVKGKIHFFVFLKLADKVVSKYKEYNNLVSDDEAKEDIESKIQGYEP
ncbi:hypothetical protein [Campylobacter sp. MIT 97-5078]|nr:hypothetical protein [Campylobacter sp. MIT 97-5078]